MPAAAQWLRAVKGDVMRFRAPICLAALVGALFVTARAEQGRTDPTAPTTVVSDP